MKLVLLSDTHLLWDKPISRLDDTKVTQFVKLKFIFDYAQKEDAKIIIAGDIFNKPRSWNLLPEVTTFLKKYNLSIFVIFGQHDVYMYSQESKDKTNLGVLAKAGLVKILNSQPVFIMSGLMSEGKQSDLYGTSYGQEIPIIKNKDHFNILVIHAPIAEKALWPGQNYMDSLTFLKEHEFNLICCGDIHQKFIKEYEGRYIINSGPLLRKEASLYNFTHRPGFFIFDTDKPDPPEFIEVPQASAEEILSRNHLEYEKESVSILSEFIDSISNSTIEEGVDFVENLWKFTKANNIDPVVVNLLAEEINKGA